MHDYGFVLKNLLVLLSMVVAKEVVEGVVMVAWPAESSVSASVLAHPLGMLSATLVFGFWTRRLWRRSDDGTYVEQDLVRWIYATVLACLVLTTIGFTAIALYFEFWWVRDLS